MRILISGAKGMLGADARRIFTELGHHLLLIDHQAAPDIVPVDIVDTNEVFSIFKEFQPDFVLHAAAMTNVDGCERDRFAAFRANAFGTWNIAAACEQVGAKLCAVSTDFVFDGEKGSPYDEFDLPAPISVYGESKWAGERLAQSHCSRCFIARTSWLYGVHGKNFPYTMLRIAQSGGPIPVVSDQIGCPTYTIDLVGAIAELLESSLYGVYHFSNAGSCSWADFGRAVLEEAGMNANLIQDISSEEYAVRFQSPTRRPKMSVLRSMALEMSGKPPLRHWREALKDFIAAVPPHHFVQQGNS